MATRLKEVDAVMVGMGWTGAIPFILADISFYFRSVPEFPDLLDCAAVSTQHQVFLSQPNFRISTENS